MNSLNPSMYIITEPEIKKSIVWGLNICVDFDLRDSSKNGEYEDLLNKKIFHNKNIVSTKLPNPIRKTLVLKLVFITIHCL